MDRNERLLNQFLVEVFQEILRTEELSIGRAGFDNLSLKELHVIDAVCRAEAEGLDNRATAVARALGVTPGTLTTAVTLLEKKGYLVRRKNAGDRRVVHIRATELGRVANKHHERFHREMVQSVMEALNPEEFGIFLISLQRIAEFFKRKNETQTGGNSSWSAS
jgi:DNA-binding MarR family transcriptional regulator